MVHQPANKKKRRGWRTTETDEKGYALKGVKEISNERYFRSYSKQNFTRSTNGSDVVANMTCQPLHLAVHVRFAAADSFDWKLETDGA